VNRFTLREVSRSRLYPIIGVALALGAPLGLLVVEGALVGRLPSARWAASEIGSDPVLYAYLVVSTSIVFAVCGWLLGRKVDSLRDTAATDPLTGLANRRTLEERLVSEIARTSRYGRPLSILIADLDGLKPLNDRHGHEAGDLALCRIARALRESCRSTDLVARFGGDEFIVLAPETTPDAAMELAERVRQRLHALPSPWSDVAAITVSIGVTGVDPVTSDTDPMALLAAADEAMYQAKSAGRDRASISRPPLKGAQP
jgi:diguanylate cyclase